LINKKLLLFSADFLNPFFKEFQPIVTAAVKHVRGLWQQIILDCFNLASL